MEEAVHPHTKSHRDWEAEIPRAYLGPNWMHAAWGAEASPESDAVCVETKNDRPPTGWNGSQHSKA
jgi:hypothetical protein